MKKGGGGPLSFCLDWSGFCRFQASACTQLSDRMTRIDLIHRQIINRGWQGFGCLVDSFGFAQDITLASNCIDAHPAGTCNFQLAPQLADKDIDDFWLRLVHAAIKMAEEGCLAENRPLAQCQKFDDPELFAGQLQLMALNQCHMAVEIDFQIADRDRGRAVAVCAANDRIKVGQKLKSVEWLGQIAICPGTQCRDLVVCAGIARNDQNRKRHVVLADQSRETCAIAIWQIYVKQHGVKGIVLQLGKSSFNVVRGGLEMPSFFKGHTQNICDNWIIFNNKNVHGSFPN